MMSVGCSLGAALHLLRMDGMRVQRDDVRPSYSSLLVTGREVLQYVLVSSSYPMQEPLRIAHMELLQACACGVRANLLGRRA